MSWNGEMIEMSTSKTLGLIVDYTCQGQSWTLLQLVGAPYSVSEPQYMYTSDDCTAKWDINYADVNNFNGSSITNTNLHFTDEHG